MSFTAARFFGLSQAFSIENGYIDAVAERSCNRERLKAASPLRSDLLKSLNMVSGESAGDVHASKYQLLRLKEALSNCSQRRRTCVRVLRLRVCKRTPYGVPDCRQYVHELITLSLRPSIPQSLRSSVCLSRTILLSELPSLKLSRLQPTVTVPTATSSASVTACSYRYRLPSPGPFRPMAARRTERSLIQVRAVTSRTTRVRVLWSPPNPPSESPVALGVLGIP